MQCVSSPQCACVSCVTGSLSLCLCICLCVCCTHHNVLCQDVMFVCVCDVCFCLRVVFVCFRLRGGVQYSNLEGAVGPWESFGRCSPPVMPFLLRSVTNNLKVLLFEVSTITQILHDKHHPTSHYRERQVVFLEDQWIGDTPSSRSPGNFGLWRWCTDRLSSPSISTIKSLSLISSSSSSTPL